MRCRYSPISRRCPSISRTCSLGLAGSVLRSSCWRPRSLSGIHALLPRFLRGPTPSTRDYDASLLSLAHPMIALWLIVAPHRSRSSGALGLLLSGFTLLYASASQPRLKKGSLLHSGPRVTSPDPPPRRGVSVPDPRIQDAAHSEPPHPPLTSAAIPILRWFWSTALPRFFNL